MTNASVTKESLLALGEADSEVIVNNLFTPGALTVQTRGGADSLQVERASLFGASVFKKAVTFDLGTGADDLRLARTTSDDKAIFQASLILTGGNGVDTYNANLAQQNTFKTPPTVGFELPVNDESNFRMIQAANILLSRR